MDPTPGEIPRSVFPAPAASSLRTPHIRRFSGALVNYGKIVFSVGFDLWLLFRNGFRAFYRSFPGSPPTRATAPTRPRAVADRDRPSALSKLAWKRKLSPHAEQSRAAKVQFSRNNNKPAESGGDSSSPTIGTGRPVTARAASDPPASPPAMPGPLGHLGEIVAGSRQCHGAVREKFCRRTTRPRIRGLSGANSRRWRVLFQNRGNGPRITLPAATGQSDIPRDEAPGAITPDRDRRSARHSDRHKSASMA